MMSMLGGEGITLYLYGDDMDTLQESAKEVAKIMEGVKGTVDVSDGLEDTSPAIKITVDKEKAMKEGLTVAQIYQELAGAIKTESTAHPLPWMQTVMMFWFKKMMKRSFPFQN